MSQWFCWQCGSVFDLRGSVPRMVLVGVVLISGDGERQEIPAPEGPTVAICPACAVEHRAGIDAIARGART